MLRNLQNLLLGKTNRLPQICERNFTSTEVSTALRPFYFSVHPDLFGQHPNERAINESSLQQLSSVLENIQASKPIRPVSLNFYLKDKVNKNVNFRLIKIDLKGNDIHSTLITILKSCGLSTDYVNSIIKPTPVADDDSFKIKYANDIDLTRMKNHPIFAHIKMQRDIIEAQEALKLKNYLVKNFADALEKSKKGDIHREEAKKLEELLTEKLQVKEIRWDFQWNDEHRRGCLLSFDSLIMQHPIIKQILKGRILVFSSFFTGVSLDGHIMLFSGEVRHNWLDFLKNINRYEAALRRIPAFEKSLSHVLRNIKVGRRKFMPKVMAGQYEQNLRQMTTSLSDYVGLKPFPKEWPSSLQDFEIVVETEAGPLMVSPTGQFIVPAAIPGSLLVNFITQNLDDASQKIITYKSDKHLERALIETCIEELQLAVLVKEDNVTPDLMIKCCNKLLDSKQIIYPYTKDLRLNISTYYSVLSDGLVCIPWNFVL